MKSISELTDFYYNDLHPDLQELEKERKLVATKFVKAAAVLAAIALGISYWIYAEAGFSDVIFFVLFAAVALGGVLYRFMIKDYAAGFKYKVIRPLIEAIEKELRYSPDAHIPRTLFERSRIFDRRIDRFRGNDLVKGSIDFIPLQFSDLHAEYKTKDSKGRTTWHTIFRGLFIVAEFNKNFKGHTVILPDSAEKLFGSFIGGWLQSNNFSRSELVKLDDPAFEKAFVVYGSDQIEARYLLTHTMMRRLLELKKKSGQKLYVSFSGDHIYLAIGYNRDLFEPSVFHSLLDYKQAMDYIQTLKMAIGIVEELKLNNKLWSKH
jgi:hypothetical protein